MKTEDMNKGVQILLERMQSNPEEFIPDWRGYYPSKWREKLDAIAQRAMRINAKVKDPETYTPLSFLKDEEILTLWGAMQGLLANRFTEEVMATLLHEAEPSDPFVEQELSSSYSQVLGEAQKRASHKVKAIDIKVAKELGMTLGEYLANKREMGIET